MIDPDDNICLTVDSLIGLNSIITGTNNMTWRKLIDQSNEKKIMPANLCSILSNEIHSFYDGNGRMCDILIAYAYKINSV